MISHLDYGNGISGNLASHRVSSVQSGYKLPPGFSVETLPRSHCSQIFDSSLLTRTAMHADFMRKKKIGYI